MKRKLFSAILFGALLTASTSGLTSCKDYDDDISNLQSQIDKLATADQLSAKVSEMQAAISAAQSAAESKAANAQTVADAAKAAAADAAAAASKAQSTADGATQAAKDAAAAAAAADEVAKAAKAAVDKLAAEGHATKAELEEAAKAAQAYVDSVKKAIEETHAADKAAIEKAINDGLDAVKAEIAKTNEELAALAKRLDACEEKLAAIEAGEGQEEALKAIQEEVEAVADALEAIIGEYTSMVTAVDLYVGGGAYDLYYALNNELRFVYVDQEKDTKFPAAEGVADEQITFSSANKNVMTTDKLVVRVSPTNAVLNAANISLLNSQGADLSDYVEVKAVKPFEELILGSTRAAEGNGLWEVEFKVKDGVDAAKFADAVSVKKGLTTYGIKYAVAVQNTESEEARRVISAYDVEVLPEDYEPATTEIAVTNRDGNWTSISDIKNRYGFNAPNKPGNIVAENKTEANKASELAWVNKQDVAGGSEPTVQDASDDRTGKKLIDVEIGKTIDIFVGGVVNPVNETSDLVKGFYVTLDSDNAIESAPSEINAWESYSYTNVGVPGDSKRPAKMFYGNEGSISIDSPAALGDIIGFRVYVVNLDGTLVDPDGRAFYVNVATEKVVAKLTAEEMVAELHADGNDVEPYHWDATKANYYVIAELTKEAAAAINSANSMDAWTITENASNYGNNTIPVAANDFTISFNKKPDFTGSSAWADAKYVKLTINTPTNFLDEGTYAAQTTLYNTKGTEICDLSVTFKKTLPEYAPVLGWAPAYNPATQVFANKAQNDPSIYKLEATTSTPAAVEMTDLMKSLEYGSWTTNSSYYELAFEKATNDGEVIELPTGTTWPATTAVGASNQYKLVPGVKAIDGKSHAVTYAYDYGYISLTKNYQTAAYTKKNYYADGKENLAMTFASWIHYEQVALAAAKTFTYRPGNAGQAVGSVVLVGEAGSAGSETLAWSVSGDVVVDLATPSATLTYYKKVADGYYQYNTSTNLYVKPDGTDFYESTEDADRIKTYGNKLVKAADKFYAKLVQGTGTSAVEYTVEVSGANFYKKISNGDYYRVAYVAADNAWKFCKADGTTVYNNQTEQNVKDQNVAGTNVTILADGTTVNPVYVWTTTTVGGTAGTKSDLVAWNTVIRNYGADGKPIFGSEAVKKNFGELVGTYLTVKSAKTGDNDPFTATVSADGKTVTLTQKTGTLNPGSKGSLTIVIVDCFGIEQSRTVEYNIAQ